MLLPMPPSLNAMFRNVAGVGRVKTKAYKAWLKEADDYYWMQKSKIKPVEGEYKLTIRVPKTMRGDADNRIKAVSDYLVSREITPDDRHCQSFTIERCHSTVECEVEVMAA